MATLWSTSRTVESTLLDKPSESPLKRPEQRRTVLEGVNGLQFQPAPPQNPMTSQTLDSHGLRAVRSSVFLSNAEPIAGKEEVMPSPTGKKRNKLSYHRTALACGHCRRRKIRCITANEDPDGRCQNCVRLKKTCAFFPIDSQGFVTKPLEKTEHSAEDTVSRYDSRDSGYFSPSPDMERVEDPMPILSSINSTNLLSPSLHPDLLQGIQHGPASTYAAFRGTPTIQSKYFPRSSDDHCGPLSPGDMDGAPLQGSPTRSTRLDSGSPSEISFIGAGESSTPVQLVTGQLKSASLSFIQELSDMILRSCITYAASSTFRQHAASASESSSSSSQHYTTQSPPSSSTSIPQKRFSQQDEEHDDDAKQGRDQDPCKPVPPPSDSANAVKLFACPYSKSDPRRYSKQNLRETRYRNCASSYLRDISRLKQHLYRVHALPKHHCVRCYESFKTRGDFGEHARKSPPCQVRSESLYQERMTEDQYDRIHRRVVKGDPCHLWYSIYEILFPKERKPPSPYVSTSDAASVAHFVVLFRAVGPEVMLEVMRDRRERAGGTLEIELPTQMVIDEAFELAAPQFVEGAGRADPQGTSMGRASSCVIPANNNLDAVRRAVLATNEMQHVPGETVLPNMSAAAPDFRAMPEQRGWQAESLETPRQVASQSMLLPAQYTTDSTFTPYWPYGYEFDPSEVTSGFDNYALLGNAQLDATGTALPTILESFPEGGSGYRQHLGYEPLQWPNHV